MRFFVKIILLISFLIWVTPALGDILVYDNCETNPVTTDMWKITLQAGGTLKTTSEIPARAGEKSYRFESYHRSEINLKGPVSNLEFEKDYWLGYSFYLPKDYRLPVKWFGTLLQFHVRNEDCDKRPTAQALAFFRGGTQSIPIIEANIAGEADRCTDNNFNYRKSFETPIKIGQWNDVVLHIKFSYKGNGINEVWMNGVKFVDQKGIINCANDPSTGAPYLKIGTYTAEDPSNNTVVYFDEIRLGDANASYSDVAPRGGGAAAENENNTQPLLPEADTEDLNPPILSIVNSDDQLN